LRRLHFQTYVTFEPEAENTVRNPAISCGLLNGNGWKKRFQNNCHRSVENYTKYSHIDGARGGTVG